MLLQMGNAAPMEVRETRKKSANKQPRRMGPEFPWNYGEEMQ